MNITPNDLTRHLKQKPRKNFIYLVTGDEILLVEESIRLISTDARVDAYEERHVIDADMPDAMDRFLSHTQNLSFLSLKKIIEVRFTQKVKAEWSKLLTEIATNPDSNNLIIIRTPKISKAETQEKWYKAIDQVGCIITIWPLKQQMLLHWIQSRCESLGLKIQKESIAHIAASTEGNLLATAQCIEKLQLVHGNSNGPVSHEMVCDMLSDQTHYTVFDLCDAALSQNVNQCLKILHTLKNQGMEPAIILWALMQDVRNLAALSAVAPNARASVYQKKGIWSTRQALFQKALSNISTQHCQKLIQEARIIDALIKGLETGNVWINLEMFCLTLSGKLR